MYEFEALFPEHALRIRTQHRAIMEKIFKSVPVSERGFLWSPRFWALSGTCLLLAPVMGSLLKSSRLSTMPFYGLRNVCKWTQQVFAHQLGRWFFWSCWRKDLLSQNINCFLWTINLWINTKIIRIGLLPRIAVDIKHRCGESVINTYADESVINTYACRHFPTVCFEMFRCGSETDECCIQMAARIIFLSKT